jgi:hypothetical protein
LSITSDFCVMLVLKIAIPKFRDFLIFKTAQALTTGQAGLNSNIKGQMPDFYGRTLIKSYKKKMMV